MGVVPEARGRGLGRRIVDFALAQAARAGTERLVLAVDAANGPALGVYRGAGFVEWERRTVYARMRPRRKE
jgi:ribosomal-protein-alanine N-acetyltransferase